MPKKQSVTISAYQAGVDAYVSGQPINVIPDTVEDQIQTVEFLRGYEYARSQDRTQPARDALTVIDSLETVALSQQDNPVMARIWLAINGISE